MNTHSLVGISASQKRLSSGLVVLGLVSIGLFGCSSSDDSSGSGGKTSAGGTSGNGGTGAGGTSSTGGSKGSGGAVASGGTVSSGGTVGSGGVHASGGAVGSGGSNAGGSSAAGGSPSDAAVSKDAAAADGRSFAFDGFPKAGAGGGTSVGAGGAGGGTSAGTGGAGGGTSAGTGGSGNGGSTGGKTSPGCGSASPLKTGNFTETIDGTTRKWMLDVPSNYDASKPYKMIFVWHPLGGSGSQVVSGGYNGLKSLSNGTAIFATADGLQGSNSETSGVGWWNKNGGDMKLFKAMLDKINASLCVDQERIFSTGFSFGGMMSYTLPFEFDVFRAVAPCSGKTGVIPYDDKFSGPVAIMAFHGDSDTFVATSLGKAFFDKFAARNKCGTQTQAVSPNGCTQYQGCTVPSIWCTFKGGHETWSEEPAAIWKFFSQF